MERDYAKEKQKLVKEKDACECRRYTASSESNGMIEN